jgi:hypothetical protein
LVFESCWLSRALSANETELKNIKNSKKMYLFKSIFTLIEFYFIKDNILYTNVPDELI